MIRKPEEFNFVKLIDRKLINVSEYLDNKNKQMEAILNGQILKEITSEIFKNHKKVVKDHNDKKDKNKNETETHIKVIISLNLSLKKKKNKKDLKTKQMKEKIAE